MKAALIQGSRWLSARLGEKGIRFEPFQARMYTHGDLFSHIIGQIDDDNQGISGLEKSLDLNLKKNDKSIILTVDKDFQFLIREELIKFNKIF